jgi:hypothetical protein
MSALQVLLGAAGFSVTVLVVVGMVLITPRGEVDLRDGATDPQGSELSRAGLPRPRSTDGREDGVARTRRS